MATSRPVRNQRAFTLIEMMVVLLIVVILAALTFASLSTANTRAKSEATKTLLQFCHDAVQERARAFYQASQGKFSPDATRDELGKDSTASESARTRLIWLLDRMRVEFPQEFDDFLRDPFEKGSTMPAVRRKYIEVFNNASSLSTHDPETESAECLYMILKFNAKQGMQFTEDMLPKDSVKDTDNDGLPEIVDAFGKPVRFYRWPVDLIAYYIDLENTMPRELRTTSNFDPQGVLYNSWLNATACGVPAGQPAVGTRREEFERKDFTTASTLPSTPYNPTSPPTGYPRHRYFRLHAAYPDPIPAGLSLKQKLALSPDTTIAQRYPIMPTIVSAGPDGHFGFVDDPELLPLGVTPEPRGSLSERCARVAAERLTEFSDNIVSIRLKASGG